MASGISRASLTTLPMAVAAASAKEVEEERAMTASALPRLSECPTVAEEVHIPRGVSSGLISRPIFAVKGD